MNFQPNTFAWFKVTLDGSLSDDNGILKGMDPFFFLEIKAKSGHYVKAKAVSKQHFGRAVKKVEGTTYVVVECSSGVPAYSVDDLEDIRDQKAVDRLIEDACD